MIEVLLILALGFLVLWWMCRKQDRKQKLKDNRMYRDWQQDENWRNRNRTPT